MPSVRVKHVNVYELWQHYGGPEEGGWWFVSGEVKHGVAVPDIEVNDFVALMRELYPEGDRNDSRTCYWSVAYNGGDHRVLVEDHEAEEWPTEWPHYE